MKFLPPAMNLSASRALTTLANLGFLSLLGCNTHSSTQQADLAFEPPIPATAFSAGEGPVVQIDEAHFNFHTVDGRYAPFAKLLRRDGYTVQGLAESATIETLDRGDILVIANALGEDDDWKLPTPSAFASAEIEAIHDWVDSGGALLLVADHMPMPGAVEQLASAFGLQFHNGFLYDTEDESHLTFTPDAGLADHPVVRGRSATEAVDSVRTFTGQAFRSTRDIEPLLVVPDGSILKLPIEAWEFQDDTPWIPADGMLQGAVMRVGSGRVAIFGEAAMFSAQERIDKDGRTLMGMNETGAEQNAQFLLNVMHWLSGMLD